MTDLVAEEAQIKKELPKLEPAYRRTQEKARKEADAQQEAHDRHFAVQLQQSKYHPEPRDSPGLLNRLFRGRRRG
jgi:hypothetical protein